MSLKGSQVSWIAYGDSPQCFFLKRIELILGSHAKEMCPCDSHDLQEGMRLPHRNQVEFEAGFSRTTTANVHKAVDLVVTLALLAGEVTFVPLLRALSEFSQRFPPVGILQTLEAGISRRWSS